MTGQLRETDVFVVGGGPAGLAAALAARRKGFRVAVADCARPPIDKACGEGLMPDSVAALEKLGATIDPADGWRLHGIHFLEGNGSAAARFPGGAGIGVRRTTLHRILAEAAERAGIALFWGERVTGILQRGVLAGGRTVRCRWIIGADGGQSRVRGWAGLDHAVRRADRYGFRRHYRIAPWSEFMEVHWADGFQVYVTPVHAQEICVAVISRDPHCRLEHALPLAPRLAARLRGAAHVTEERGAVTGSCRLRSVHTACVALIGDASGWIDAITGEGLCLAFRQANALAEAMAAGDLERYEKEHRRIMHPPELMASLMLGIGSRNWLRRRAIGALASKPNAFSQMLAAHVGASRRASLAVAALSLGWGMLAS